MEDRKGKRMQEEELDRELALLMEDVPEQDDFEKKIDKYIQKKIRKITVGTVLSIVLHLQNKDQFQAKKKSSL